MLRPLLRSLLVMEGAKPDEAEEEKNVVPRGGIITGGPAILESEDESYCSEEDGEEEEVVSHKMEKDTELSMRIGIAKRRDEEDDDHHHRRISVHQSSSSSSSATLSTPQVSESHCTSCSLFVWWYCSLLATSVKETCSQNVTRHTHMHSNSIVCITCIYTVLQPLLVSACSAPLVR